MNWNGHAKNNVLGNLAACKESIATTKQRGSLEGAGWLLEKVDCERNQAAVIGFVSALGYWCDSVPEIEREKWLIKMMIDRPIEIRRWMGYAEDWTMMPADVCSKREEIVRLAQSSKLPGAYLLPATPRKSDAEKVGIIKLDNGWMVHGVKLATVTYMLNKGEWYKVYYPKLPSKSAVSRAMRLYLLSIMVGRQVNTVKDLLVYEMMGIRRWMSYDGDIVNGLADHAGHTLFHLLLEPEMVLGD